MGIIESGSAKPTDWGKVITEALNKRRTALFDDLIIQHMRFFPTMAYTMDIVLDSDEGISVEDVNSQLQQESAADSSFQKNSIQNCLNLISNFGIINFEEGTASPLTRSAVATEAIPYAIQLLAGEDSQITSEILREKLPLLLYCQEEDAEDLFEEARRRHPIYNYNTRGDRARLQPYGSVFEIELSDTSPQYLLSLL
jgi:hypothetical protein